MRAAYQRILDYIERFGSITPLEAFRDLGQTKLASRIGEMRELGYVIDGDFELSENRFGETTRYMRYSFPVWCVEWEIECCIPSIYDEMKVRAYSDDRAREIVRERVKKKYGRSPVTLNVERMEAAA